MHKKFTSFIRKDGMGIDYSKFNYRFKDPLNGQRGSEDEDDEEEYDDEE